MEEKSMDRKGSAAHRVKDFAHCGLFAALLAVCACITVPGPVPFTLQTFAVFAATQMLGGGRALWSLAVYIVLGALGLPVFSGFQGGIGVLFGATGGYIVGFLAIPLCDLLLRWLFGDRTPVRAAASLAGLLFCYAAGTLWFLCVYTAAGKVTTPLSVLGMCVFPFILPDLLKLTAATLLSERLRRIAAHSKIVNKK